MPKLMFQLFSCGKALGTKVKFSRFYLILDTENLGDNDCTEVFQKFVAAFRKKLSTHKQGENGFKPGADGSYFNILDTLNETFKYIEEAIDQTGVNTADKKILKLGVNVDAEANFLKEQQKYDYEGPKNAMDFQQIGDYWIKLCNDHPLIEYLEDPLSSEHEDPVAYQSIVKKFSEF